MKTNSKRALNRTTAFAKDSEFYAEYDNETEMWCVFGDNTGFAYGSFCDQDDAEAKASEMNASKVAA